MRIFRNTAAALLAMALYGGTSTYADAVQIPMNSPADITDWRSDYETWLIEDGVLTQAPAITSGRRSVFWRPTEYYGDFELNLEFRVLEDNLQGSGFGIFYRAKNDKEFMSVQVDPRPGRTAAVLSRSLPEREVNNAVVNKEITIEVGKWHQARIVAKGNTHEFYLDGQKVLTSNNAVLKSGAIGLRVNSARTQFRNLSIDGEATRPTEPFPMTSLPFVTVAHEGGAGSYEGFPDICRLESGELLCVFYSGYKHVPSGPDERLPNGGYISLVRSRDEGKTWSEPVIIYASDVDDHDPQITRLSDGRLVVTICSWPVRGTHKPFIIWSEDDGVTWSKGEELEQPLAATEVPQGPIIELPTGELLMPTYGTVEKGDPDSAAVVRISRDGGKTWPWQPEHVLRSPIKDDKQDMHVHEPCIVRLNDGRLLMLARQRMHRWESTDNGVTWQELEPMPFRGDSPNLFLTSKNILLCGIRFRGIDKTGRLRGTCVTYSLDEGKTWSEPVLVSPVIGGYTGMVELPDGRIFMVYYTEGDKSDIRGVWFTADEKGITVLPIE